MNAQTRFWKGQRVKQINHKKEEYGKVGSVEAFGKGQVSVIFDYTRKVGMYDPDDLRPVQKSKEIDWPEDSWIDLHKDHVHGGFGTDPGKERYQNDT